MVASYAASIQGFVEEHEDSIWSCSYSMGNCMKRPSIFAPWVYSLCRIWADLCTRVDIRGAVGALFFQEKSCLRVSMVQNQRRAARFFCFFAKHLFSVKHFGNHYASFID